MNRKPTDYTKVVGDRKEVGYASGKREHRIQTLWRKGTAPLTNLDLQDFSDPIASLLMGLIVV